MFLSVFESFGVILDPFARYKIFKSLKNHPKPPKMVQKHVLNKK